MADKLIVEMHILFSVHISTGPPLELGHRDAARGKISRRVWLGETRSHNKYKLVGDCCATA